MEIITTKTNNKKKKIIIQNIKVKFIQLQLILEHTSELYGFRSTGYFLSPGPAFIDSNRLSQTYMSVG